jgi:hypothetical protein
MIVIESGNVRLMLNMADFGRTRQDINVGETVAKSSADKFEETLYICQREVYPHPASDDEPWTIFCLRK